MLSSAASAIASELNSGAFIGSVPITQASKWLILPLSLIWHTRVFVPAVGLIAMRYPSLGSSGAQPSCIVSPIIVAPFSVHWIMSLSIEIYRLWFWYCPPLKVHVAVVSVSTDQGVLYLRPHPQQFSEPSGSGLSHVHRSVPAQGLVYSALTPLSRLIINVVISIVGSFFIFFLTSFFFASLTQYFFYLFIYYPHFFIYCMS